MRQKFVYLVDVLLNGYSYSIKSTSRDDLLEEFTKGYETLCSFLDDDVVRVIGFSFKSFNGRKPLKSYYTSRFYTIEDDMSVNDSLCNCIVDMKIEELMEFAKIGIFELPEFKSFNDDIVLTVGNNRGVVSEVRALGKFNIKLFTLDNLKECSLPASELLNNNMYLKVDLSNYSELSDDVLFANSKSSCKFSAEALGVTSSKSECILDLVMEALEGLELLK